MHIVHLITRLILGGAQENTILSCLGQAQLGHRVTLIHGPTTGPEGSLIEQLQGSSVTPIQEPTLIRAVQPWTDVRCYRQLRRILRELRPQVVHTHSSKAGIVGRYAACHERVPKVIHTIHGLPFHPYQSRFRNALYIHAERAAARKCQRIVCVADAMTRQALAAGVGHPAQFVTIYSGMDIAPYLHNSLTAEQARQQLGINHHGPLVGTVARLTELKGHDDLLDALGDWLRTHPRVNLLWVGDGSFRPRLAQRIAALGLTQRIHITGLLSPDLIPTVMRALDLLVHPSYREGLARTLPQALLSRTPVVSYDVDGACEVCVDGVTGRLVKPADHDGLRDAVNWMLEHPVQAQTMAQHGREHCQSRFDAQTMVRELLRVYQE